MTLAIVWFRRDLRLHDNHALRHALARAQHVVPVYVHAPEEERPWPPGAASRWWLHHSLESFQAELQRLGSRLVLTKGPAAAALRRVAHAAGARLIVWNRLYEPHIQARDRQVEQALQEAGYETASFEGALLFEPWSQHSKSGRPYQLFTPFWKSCQGQLPPDRPQPRPRNLKPPQRWPTGVELRELGLLPRTDWAGGLGVAWRPGESGGLAQLRRFSRLGLPHYDEGRDMPASDAVSRLSPYLHFGELTPRQIWHTTSASVARSRGRMAARSHASYLRQIGWREFAHHVLHHWPSTPEQPLRQAFAYFPWRRHYDEFLKAWQQGRTGYPLVDAGMRELWETGWMHNRVRMVVASFLVKNCRIPWQVGARWFWDTLVDADLANNTLGWQWAAGCGADAAVYFRIFNPVLQAKRFDPEGTYIRRWVPELAGLPAGREFAPWAIPGKGRHRAAFVPGRDYPSPIIDFAVSRREALAAYEKLVRGR